MSSEDEKWWEDKPNPFEPPKGFVELLTDLRRMYEEKDGFWQHDNVNGIRRIFDYLETKKGLKGFLKYLKAYCTDYIEDHSMEELEFVASKRGLDVSFSSFLREEVKTWMKTNYPFIK